jgi:hypothetical protein
VLLITRMAWIKPQHNIVNPNNIPRVLNSTLVRINHELCHYIDDVTRMVGFRPQNEHRFVPLSSHARALHRLTLTLTLTLTSHARCTPFDLNSLDKSFATPCTILNRH